MGLEYYFKARNADNLIGRSPEDSVSAATKYHRTRLKLTSSQIPQISLAAGGGLTDYKIISVPLALSNMGIAENFEELGGADKDKYRFLRYRETPRGWDEYPNGGLTTLKRGEGYFVNVKSALSITLNEGDIPDNSQGNPFQMQLKQGWNEIGNPYTSQIQWSEVLTYNNNPAGVGILLKFNSGYQPDNTGLMEPYSGGFVQVDNDVMVKIPFKGITTGGKVDNNSEVMSSMDEKNWEIPFDLVTGEIRYMVAGIGMRETAQNGKDNFDIVTPPHLGDYIEMNFPHPEHFMKRFTRDVVQTQEEYTWDFTVDTNLEGDATLTWDNARFGDNNKELFLVDIAMQSLINMRDRSVYSFNPLESNRFRIHFGTNLEKKIKPDFVFLGMAYPNPTTGVTSIPFTLPENSRKFAVRLEVFDLMGRKVATLAQGDYGPGFYQADWVIRDSNLGNGIYTYRLLVGGEKKSEVLSGKVMLMR